MYDEFKLKPARTTCHNGLSSAREASMLMARSARALRKPGKNEKLTFRAFEDLQVS
jgi:hypothetical protein